jgi:hypothetical protein
MKFIRDWLRIERPAGILPHPAQRVEIPCSYDETWNACVRGIEDVLGGVVRESNQASGTLEASFGLVNSERLTCALEALEPKKTRVLIEGRRGPSPQPATSSQYVSALAEYLVRHTHA